MELAIAAVAIAALIIQYFQHCGSEQKIVRLAEIAAAPKTAATRLAEEPSEVPLYVSPDLDAEWDAYVEDRASGKAT